MPSSPCLGFVRAVSASQADAHGSHGVGLASQGRLVLLEGAPRGFAGALGGRAAALLLIANAQTGNLCGQPLEHLHTKSKTQASRVRDCSTWMLMLPSKVSTVVMYAFGRQSETKCEQDT